jgi:3-oxoacyl-ACP reductase-like protein
MSIFGSIMSKIFQIGTPAAAAGTQAATAAPAADAPAAAAAAAGVPAEPVDVEAVLTQMASQKGGGGNWQTSIVDLLKLLDLDSSLNARKELGGELNVHAGADGSAEQNIALHKAVMQKLAENGGKVPDSLRG